MINALSDKLVYIFLITLSPWLPELFHPTYVENRPLEPGLELERFHMTSQRPYWCQNNETAAMLVSQTSSLGAELFSNANAFFCSNKFA